MSQLERLKEITRTLREPGGCEWDREQDYRSMRRYILEETHELIHAIEQGDFENLVEELGDVLFHVFFFARMGEEQDRFSLEDIARGISDKLVRRHPHVFGDVQVNGVGEILKNWDEIKAREKQGSEDPQKASAVPAKTGRELPALMRAEKIQKKAARVGFDWRDAPSASSKSPAPNVASLDLSGVASSTLRAIFGKVQEELEEVAREIQQLESAGQPIKDAAPETRARLEEEVGDVFFSVVNLARHLKVEPETSVNRANEKFLRRFHAMEALAARRNLDFAALNEEQLDELWTQAKRAPS
ncbi:MAG: nucleoside triphosphate pyrophosphohydrolase [Leptospirales bacterium]|jgi:uncharacterized protein YabN with tetrapyrrole methylase and pyrophosphatase domain